MPMLGPMTRKLNRKRRVKTSAQFVNVSFIDVDCSLAKTSSVVCSVLLRLGNRIFGNES